MKYRTLGRSGLKVSTISLGSWLTFAKIGQDMVNRLVRVSLDAGINLFDTADVYDRGVAESMLAKALEGHRRDHVVIASKCYFPMSEVVTDCGLSRKHIVESCEHSLRRLRTDYLDLYQCHRYDTDTPLEETVRAMGELIARGKILYWGTSMWSAPQLREACRIAERLNVPSPISEQPRYSLLHRELEQEVLGTCEQLGIGCIVWSPLAQGLLTGKYRPDLAPATGTRGSEPHGIGQFLVADLADAKSWALVERAQDAAARAHMPLPRFALAWCLRRQTIASVIVGATRTEQLAENLEAAAVSWSPDLQRLADAIPA